MSVVTVEKVSIKKCVRQGKKLRWKPKRIAETLHYLGFKDEEISKVM